MTPVQRLTALVRELEKIAGQLDPVTQSAVRGEAMIIASRLRSLTQRLAAPG